MAQPNFSKIQMTRAEMSSCPRSTPWRAPVGSAWWELCQDSPMDRIASGQKFAARSRLSNGREPTMWQMELTDQVTWCRNATRTKPAQNSAVTPPHTDQVIRPPSTPGRPSVTTVSGTNSLSTARRSGSASRSGAKRSALVWSRSNSQPMCECQKPLAMAAGEVPNSQGECGSPSRSENAWWRRWSATQATTEPCEASPPATASAIRSGRLALKEPWVKRRW